MSDRNLDDLHPTLKPLCEQWLAACKTQSINSFVTQTYRSIAQQNADYAVGRDTNGKVVGKIITNARGGKSMHNFTLPDGTPASKAFDFAIEREDGTLNWSPTSPEWNAAVAIGKGLGLAWGGDWHSIKDYDHWQLPD